jgi:hypothetical protein
MNLDSVAAELFALPLDQFTPRRNAKAKELKAAGQAELSHQVSALKKPTTPLWATNHIEPDLLAGLRGAAQAVVKAQSAAAAGRPNAARDLRTASEDLQRRLDAAGADAARVLTAGGHAAGEDALRRVREILRLLAIQGGDDWSRLQKGALANEPRPGGDMLQMFGAGGDPAGARQVQAEARQAAEQAARAARSDQALAERAMATARRLRLEATAAAAAAQHSAERAAAAEVEAKRAGEQAEKSQRELRRQAPAKRR